MVYGHCCSDFVLTKEFPLNPVRILLLNYDQQVLSCLQVGSVTGSTCRPLSILDWNGYEHGLVAQVRLTTLRMYRSGLKPPEITSSNGGRTHGREHDSRRVVPESDLTEKTPDLGHRYRFVTFSERQVGSRIPRQLFTSTKYMFPSPDWEVKTGR